MAKKKELTAFEEEVVNYYMNDYLQSVALGEDNSMEELGKLILKAKYGGESRAPRWVIDYDSLFHKHVCPVCGDLISLQGKEYACGNCNLRIPLELYDRALKYHEKEAEMMANGREISKRIGESGLSKERTDGLYDMGMDRALIKLQEKEKQK